ncbi:homeobox-leucine zipper protein HDG11-like [Pyrus ussuriensis x Pyrus communis]|uniref:Homeobox-leucine zipper protein HDG11-like n=1 Tax=Pyrus ussuriensis x Pyrus communis TaxID=2448454 RepID=A0A5N5GL37_9ROSA|nr:homeobox-leucine zipper protein HDG11-like [Pyrus ussuriensis x Pyrus communis]
MSTTRLPNIETKLKEIVTEFKKNETSSKKNNQKIRGRRRREKGRRRRVVTDPTQEEGLATEGELDLEVLGLGKRERCL